MKRSKQNQYPENPHLPGTLAAAGWDLNEASRRLGESAKIAFKRDAERILAATKRIRRRR